MISYPGGRAPAPVGISQKGFTAAIPSRSAPVLNQLPTPAITPGHQDPTLLELDSGGGQQAEYGHGP